MDEGFPFSVLVSGQALTSRTDTIEDYLRTRVPRLGVIGLASPFLEKNVARSTEYRNGQIHASWPVSSVLVRSQGSLAKNLRLVGTFGTYYREIGRCARRMGGPFDLFIGISCFSALAGLALKRKGLVRKHIYYCIDYYPRPSKLCLNSLVVAAVRAMDRYCVRRTDLVWHITPKIAEARAEQGGMPADRYRKITVPLSFRASMCRFPAAETVERWTIGFVGVISKTQGLQLLVEAMPALVRRFPDLKVRLVGHGAYAAELKALVESMGMTRHFVFHGFVENEEEMLDIVSRCAVAVAPWTQSSDNYVLNADPGKPKLYMCLGVPCILTRGPEIAEVVDSSGAGVAIDYSSGQLESAVATVLSDDGHWREMRRRASALGGQFVSEKILSEAMAETVRVLRFDVPVQGRSST